MLALSKSNVIKGYSSVFQRLRSLEKNYNDEQTFFKNLKLKADLSLSFPASDFSIENGSDKNFTMNFMTLIGVDGCLPSYFNDLLCSGEDQKRLQDFLDIFHQHIFLLSYKAWKEQRPDVLLEFGNEKWLSILNKIMPRLNLNSDPMSFSPYLLCNKKTSFSLANIIRKIFYGYRCKILSTQADWYVHGLENKLGNKQMIMGENAFIGDKFLSRSQTIHIQFQSLAPSEFERLKKNKNQLTKALLRYIDIFHTISLSAEVNYHPSSLCLGKDSIEICSSLCLTNRTYNILFKL